MSNYDDLERIHKLYKEGILSEEEYQKKKNELLSMPSEPREIQQVRTENSLNDELDSRWANTIAAKLAQGYSIVERDDKFHIAILESSTTKNVNHILHGILTVLTCIWGIVWLIEISGEKKAHRIRLTVDSSGRILEERLRSH